MNTIIIAVIVFAITAFLFHNIGFQDGKRSLPLEEQQKIDQLNRLIDFNTEEQQKIGAKLLELKNKTDKTPENLSKSVYQFNQYLNSLEQNVSQPQEVTTLTIDYCSKGYELAEAVLGRKDYIMTLLKTRFVKIIWHDREWIFTKEENIKQFLDNIKSYNFHNPAKALLIFKTHLPKREISLSKIKEEFEKVKREVK